MYFGHDNPTYFNSLWEYSLLEVGSLRGNLLRITNKNISIFYSKVLVVNKQEYEVFPFPDHE